MLIVVYNNNTLMTPLKCGTRYIDKIWSDTRIQYTHNDFMKIPKVKYIVVRPPIEHLLTGLHTDILKYVNEINKNGNFEQQIRNYVSNNAVHWCSQLYEYLYYYRNIHNDENTQVVKLENLTELIKSLGYEVEYNPDEYRFTDYKKWWSKEELFELLKKMYPKEIEWLLNKVDEQNQYYFKLVNNEMDEKILDRFKVIKLI